MRLAMVFNHEELCALNTPVIVEMWEKRLFGRIKRAWLAEFSEQERRAAKRIYDTAYRWYLVKGVPQEHLMSAKTYNLIQRLVNFFGCI